MRPASSELLATIAKQDRERPWRSIADHLPAHLRRIGDGAKPKRKRIFERRRNRSLARKRSYRVCCPVDLVSDLSPGIVAVLDVIAWQVKKRGFMDWCNERLAAMAGVSCRTVQRALAEAVDRGLISRVPRKKHWDHWLPSIVRIVHKGWLRWIKNKKPQKSEMAPRMANYPDTGEKQAAHSQVETPQGFQKVRWQPPERRS